MHSKRTHARRSYPLILLAGLFSACVVYCGWMTAAYAQTKNARVAGDLTPLHELVRSASELSCDLPSCSISLRPVVLSLRAPHAGHTKIVLTRAKISNPLSGDLEENSEERPILLRGRTIPTREQAHSAQPVAATIFRDAGALLLEVVVSDTPRENGKPSRGLMVFKLSLGEPLTSSRLNARAQAHGSQAFAARRCGAHADELDQHVDHRSKSGIQSAAAQQYPVLYLGTDYDPLFANRLKCTTTKACQNKILSIINQAAVFYERQLGYTLEIARQFGPTNHGRATLSEMVIDGFQEYNFANRLQFVHTTTNTTANQVDSFLLFTGREMDSDVIGVAYVGTMCQDTQSRFTNAVVQHASSALNPVTTAHEVGHTLNAQHVPEGIMRANLGSSPPTSFASASIQTITSYLNQWYRECRKGVSNGVAKPTPTPTSSGGSDPFAGKPTTLQLTVVSSSPKSVTISTTVSAVTAGCSTRIRAAATARGAPKASPILNVTQTDLGNVVTGAATFRVLPDSSKNINVYFFADYSCSDGETIEVSRTLRFNPNRVKGIAKKARSKKAWLSALRKSLR